jgi:radical SAM protein with 4Fe4S-binding SPASM domain
MVGRAKKTFAKETQFNRTVGLNAIINTYDIPHQSIYSEVNTRLTFKKLLNRFYNAGMELPNLRCDGGTETFMVSSGGEFLPCSQYAYGPKGEIRNPSVNLVTDSPFTISRASEEYLEFNNSMAGLEVKNFSTCQTCDNQESCAPCPLANPAGIVPECEWVKTKTETLNNMVRESTVALKIEPEQIGESEISFKVETQKELITLSMDRLSLGDMINLGQVKNMEEWAGTDLVPTLCQLRSHQIISISGMESNIT